MFYVDINESACANSHRLRGWFPTRELADMHIASWPSFIAEGMTIVDEGLRSAGPRHPPESLHGSIAKALNDHNANVARMVSSDAEWLAAHPGNIITSSRVQIEPKEPDAVQRAWLDKVKAENEKVIDLMLITAFEAGVASVENPDDGRPCTMDNFVANLFEACDDHYDREAAINHWLHGEWTEAMAYLKDEDADE